MSVCSVGKRMGEAMGEAMDEEEKSEDDGKGVLTQDTGTCRGMDGEQAWG